MNRAIRPRTSSRGRCQFSLLNAKSVSTATPCCSQARSSLRMTSTPARCPATAGRPRAFAQRPLPSMMTATWRGMRDGDSVTGLGAARTGGVSLVPRRSDFHQVLFLRGELLVDLGDEAIGELL